MTSQKNQTLKDRFSVLEIKDDMSGAPVFKLRCVDCNEQFEANTDIIKPQNVTHDLGTSLTFSCPKCPNSVVIYEKEAKLEALKEQIEEAEAFLAELNINPNDLKFAANGVEWGTMSAKLHCLKCEATFNADVRGGLNVQVMSLGDGTNRLCIKCPSCGNEDVVDKEQAAKRLAFVATTVRLGLLKSACKEIEEGVKL